MYPELCKLILQSAEAYIAIKFGELPDSYMRDVMREKKVSFESVVKTKDIKVIQAWFDVNTGWSVNNLCKIIAQYGDSVIARQVKHNFIEPHRYWRCIAHYSVKYNNWSIIEDMGDMEKYNSLLHFDWIVIKAAERYKNYAIIDTFMENHSRLTPQSWAPLIARTDPKWVYLILWIRLKNHRVGMLRVIHAGIVEMWHGQFRRGWAAIRAAIYSLF